MVFEPVCVLVHPASPCSVFSGIFTVIDCVYDVGVVPVSTHIPSTHPLWCMVAETVAYTVTLPPHSSHVAVPLPEPYVVKSTQASHAQTCVNVIESLNP